MKTYQRPQLRVFCIEGKTQIASISSVDGAGLKYRGGGNGDARVKEDGGFDIWDE